MSHTFTLVLGLCGWAGVAVGCGCDAPEHDFIIDITVSERLSADDYELAVMSRTATASAVFSVSADGTGRLVALDNGAGFPVIGVLIDSSRPIEAARAIRITGAEPGAPGSVVLTRDQQALSTLDLESLAFREDNVGVCVSDVTLTAQAKLTLSRL